MGKEEKKLLVAVVVLAIVLIVGGLLKKNLISQQEQDELALKLFTFSDFSKIELSNINGIQSLQKKDESASNEVTYRDHEFTIDHRWYIDGEPKLYVKPAMMDTLFQSMEELQIVQTIKNGENRVDEYGLQNPIFTLMVENQKEHKFLAFGGLTSDQTGRYVWDQALKKVYIVSLNVDFLENRTRDEWVEKSILRLQPRTIKNITFVSADTNIELSQNDNHWFVQKNGILSADDNSVQNWFRDINTIEAQSVLINVDIKSTPLKKIIFKEYAFDQTDLVLSLYFQDSEWIVQRSDDSLTYVLHEKEKDDFFMMPDKLVLLPRINNDQDVSYVSIETPTMNYVLENGLEWSAKKPFEDAVSTERLQSIFELVGQIEPVEIIPATKNAKGIKFDIQEGEKTMQFVLDIKNHVMMVQGQNPYAVRVETPQQFETLLLEHLQNIRKRDLYPFTINDIDMIDIVKEKKSIHMKKNENGDWNATGLDDSSLQYEIVSTLEELKIDAWTDRKNFERVGDIEIVLGSKKGMAYTWHLGKSKDGKQMLLNIPKFTVGLVDQAKLEELINKL